MLTVGAKNASIRNTERLSKNFIEEAFNGLITEYDHIIDAPELTTGFTPKQHYPILKEAYDNKDVIFKDVLFRRLLFYLFVLEYKEGGLRWYDLHPAVKQVLIKKLKQPGT